MSGDERTVYVNDNPIGETEVYHSRRGHVSTLRRFSDRYVREATVAEAQEDGLRPCKQCFPDDSGAHCPACGHLGNGDDVLSHDQRWCGNGDCKVVSFREGSGS